MIRQFADHSANERTFLAWIRTATGVVGFGLAAARLGSGALSLASMIALLFAGGVVILVAFVRMCALRGRIEAAVELDSGRLTADGLLGLLVIALLVMLGAFALHVTGG